MRVRSVVVSLAVVLAAGGGVARADAARECRLHDSTIKTKDLGCFDELKSTEDHTYGTRLCLVRAGNTCSGVMWFWDGNLEGDPAILDDVTCTKSGTASFFGSHDEGALIQLMSFSGKISRRVLRGSFKYGKQSRRVAWKQTKDGFDAVDLIRTRTREACSGATH